MLTSSAPAKFYLLPGRVWEFFIGALVSVYEGIDENISKECASSFFYLFFFIRFPIFLFPFFTNVVFYRFLVYFVHSFVREIGLSAEHASSLDECSLCFCRRFLARH
jgi:hypothetical protein